MKKIIAFGVLAFALVAGTAAVTLQLAPPAYADPNGGGGGGSGN
jgi:hypothetical protein